MRWGARLLDIVGSIPRFTVRHRVAILITAAVLLVPAVYGTLNVSIEYDLLKYMPRDLESVRGYEVLDREFRYAERAAVVVKGQPDWAVLSLKDKLSKIDGVSSVFWLSDLADPTIPHDYLGEELVSQFYRGDDGDITFLMVSLAEDSSSPRTVQAIDDIKRLLGEGQYLVGEVVSGIEMKELGMSQMPRMIRTAAVLIFLVLIVTLPSAAMPFIFMVTIGAAYAYNMAISYALGQKVSYLTSSVAAAMQLGVTMDYCIFLMHSFHAERQQSPAGASAGASVSAGGNGGSSAEAEAAMERAIAKTANAILSSALTTAAGFAALALMRVRLGADMGLLMARGVLLSVVCTLVVLPSLVLALQSVIDRLTHPVLLPSFRGLASLVVRGRVPVFAVALLVLVVGFVGSSRVSLSYDIDSTFPRDMPSIAAMEEFGDVVSGLREMYIVARGVPGWRLQRMTAALRGMDGVTGAGCLADVVDPAVPLDFVPDGVASRYVAGEYSAAILSVDSRASDEAMNSLIAGIREMLPRALDQANASDASDASGASDALGASGASGALDAADASVYFTGGPVIASDLMRLTSHDISVVNMVSVAAIFIIVAIAFRSLTAPVVLVAAIQCAIWLNQSISYFTHTPLFFFSGLAINAIQLGATVDYAILMASTFRGKLGTCSPTHAMRLAVEESGPAILCSGGAMFAAIMGVYASTSLRAAKDLAALLARGAIVSTVVTTVLLPAVLLMAHKVLAKTSAGWPEGTREGFR